MMQRLRQSFQNNTDRPQFINLELSTARFRLNPKEELILFYDADEEQDELGAALRIEFVAGWEMFFPDGRPAPLDYGRALS